MWPSQYTYNEYYILLFIINYGCIMLFLVFYRIDGWNSIAEAVGTGHSSPK
jgi:hypothetical protein